MFCCVLSCFAVFCGVLSCFVAFCNVLSCFVMFCHVLSWFLVFCHVFLCLISRIFVAYARIQFISVPSIHQGTRTRPALPLYVQQHIRMSASPSLCQLVYDHREQKTDMWVHMAMGSWLVKEVHRVTLVASSHCNPSQTHQRPGLVEGNAAQVISSHVGLKPHGNKKGNRARYQPTLPLR